MHICFTGQYPYKNQTAGGVGTFTQTLAEKLVQKNVRVSVIASYPAVDEIYELQNGVHIYWLNQNKWSYANFVRNAYRANQLLHTIHREHPIDIVETQEAGLAFINRIDYVRYVIRLHGGHYFFSRSLGKPFSRTKGLLEQRSFKKADAFIGVSRFVLNETARYIDIDQSKAVVIPNPIDCNRFYLSDAAKVVEGRILFAGRLVEKKGIRQLIEAMPIVLKKMPTVQLHIYGGDTTIDHGSSFQKMLEDIVPATAKNNIVFKGEIKNEALPAMLEQAQLCVYPSHMEAMPIAWLEVMAMGKPFIASRTGPGPEVIADGIDGLLCDPYSAEDIAAKIIWMLENKEAAKEMGMRARQKIADNYELEMIAQTNLNFFKSICAIRNK